MPTRSREARNLPRRIRTSAQMRMSVPMCGSLGHATAYESRISRGGAPVVRALVAANLRGTSRSGGQSRLFSDSGAVSQFSGQCHNLRQRDPWPELQKKSVSMRFFICANPIAQMPLLRESTMPLRKSVPNAQRLRLQGSGLFGTEPV